MYLFLYYHMLWPRDLAEAGTGSAKRGGESLFEDVATNGPVFTLADFSHEFVSVRI
jgi:hypothetical protein